MSSYKGLLFSFEINPQPLPRFWLLALWLLPCAVLVLSITSLYRSTFSLFPFSFIFIFSFYFFYFYWAYRCYQEFVCLSLPESPRAISCQQGMWEIQLHNSKQMQKLSLQHYYLNSHYIVLHFSATESSATENISKFKPWQGKKTVMIFPAQLGEENFRLLFRLLKFQHRALSVSVET